MEISIIIPSYNCEKYLSRAIRSALGQNFPKDKYEIIVVDDGSTDNTPEVIRSFGNRIRPIRLENNCGLPAARNVGIKNALGRFILNLDADDYLHMDCIFIEQLFLGENAHFHAVSCDYFLVDENEEHIERVSALKSPIACGIMFRKDDLIKIGLYDEEFRTLEDLDLRKRYLDQFNIHNIELPLYRYRMHKDNITKKVEEVKYYEEKLQIKHNSEQIISKINGHENIRGVTEQCR